MKKKIVSLILASAMTVVSLAGCGAGAPAAPAADNGTAPAETAAPAADSAAEAVEDSTGEAAPAEPLTGIDAIIAEAETMSMISCVRK